NKDKALKILRAKLYDRELERMQSQQSAERKNQVGTGDRSERIRTYNFPQGRVTDHRVGLTLYRIDEILDGDLDEIIDTLITSDRAERLNN
ncbi:MAG: peptide chain release factor 1, partial [Defluviitaleaceae bacterium]|nr:peptide chain release factor 1 [Defluviitaleaceae bacterium]